MGTTHFAVKRTFIGTDRPASGRTDGPPSLQFLHDGVQNIHTAVNAAGAGVEGDIIVLRLAPLSIRVIAVVVCPRLILLAEALLHTFTVEAVIVHRTIHLVLQGSVDKYMEGIVPILQDVVGAAADDDALLLLRDILNDIALYHIQLILQRKHVTSEHLSGIGHVAGDVEQKAAGNVLALLLDKLLRQTTLLRNAIDQFLVIKCIAEFLRKLAADGTSAAAALTADGDDSLHSLFRRGKCPLLSSLYQNNP